VREDAFVFPTTEAALRYYVSGAIDALEDMPADGSHRPKLLEAVAEQVESVIRAEGVFGIQRTPAVTLPSCEWRSCSEPIGGTSASTTH
jgi:hypothetical protein